MYTGTLIDELMATVEQAEQGGRPNRAGDERFAQERELRRYYELQVPTTHNEIFAGAA
jgi:hypothetical protein